jgi:TonB family protein
VIRVVLAASLCLCGAAVNAADAFDWKKTLEQPLSPGTVAILVEHGSEAEVQARWRAGLESDDAGVRAATARAIYGAGEKALVPAIKEALETERDRSAAEEQIRALVALGPPEGDVSVVAAARRLPELRVLAWNHLGRARGTGALVHLAAAREGDNWREDRRSLVRAAVNGGRNGLTEAAEVALREKDAAAWYVIWESLLAGGGIADGPLVASVTSTDPRIRAITYWSAAVVDQHGNMPKGLKKAVETAPEASADRKAIPQDAEQRLAHFTFGLLARATGGKRQEDVEWVQALPKEQEAWPFPSPATAVAKLFSKDERARLVELKHLPRNVEDRLDRTLWVAKAFAVAAPTTVRTAMIHDFPRGYVSGLAALTGCRDRDFMAVLAYGTDGRPRSVTLVEADGLSEECARTGRILLASRPFSAFSEAAHVRASAPAPGPETVRLRVLDEGTLAWDQRRGAAGDVVGGVVGGVVGEGPDGPIRVGGTIKDPKKLKHVNPAYPAAAREARVQGVVILEAVIGRDGRVEDLKVLRSLPLLDAAATDAVRQWVYTPTLLNGVPTPVIMTVTVAFTLQ